MRHVAAAAIFALLAVPASAQVAKSNQRPRTPIDRIFVSIDGVYQTGGEDFTDSKTFVRNAEDGSFATNYSVESGPAFNVSGGVHLTQKLAVGVGVSRFSHSTPTSITASVPHPFFFDRDRALAGDIGGLTREELAVHVQARLVIPVSRRLQATVFGGPSFFRVTQDIVNDFTYTESYPFDTAALASTVTSSVNESALGFNVGADLSYFFTPQLGLGGTVQVVGANVDMPSAGSGTVDASAGKLQAGAGLRLRF
jgi:outer membrane protein with beta-barrel domain